MDELMKNNATQISQVSYRPERASSIAPKSSSF
jgi:hypothetical protein